MLQFQWGLMVKLSLSLSLYPHTLSLSLCVMHTGEMAQHQKPRALIGSFRQARSAPKWTRHFNKEFTVS